MNYEDGKPLARITYRGTNKTLKYDTNEPEIDVDSNESIKRFGHKKPMLSFFERVMELTPEELKEAIKLNPSLKTRIKEEIENKKVPKMFNVEKSSKSTEDGWIERVHIDGSRFIPTFDSKDFREIIYIYGASGSGKSALCRSYIDEYRREFPANKVFLFSLKDADITLEDKDIARIPNQLDILTAIDIETMRDSLVIFDDTEGYDKAISNEQKEIYRIQDNIAQLGRDRRIFCIVTTHLACKGNKTKVILNECHKIISFPGRVPHRSFEYLMIQYGGLDKKEVGKIWKLKSRWVCINKENPRYVLYETGCYTLA